MPKLIFALFLLVKLSHQLEGNATDVELKCPTGWTGISRVGGQNKTVCHRWFKGWLKYHESIEICKKEGGELSTFTDKHELDVISGLNQGKTYGFWVGMAIKDECKGVRYDDDDHAGKCSKRNLWEFTGRLTEDITKAREFVESTWEQGEPNNWSFRGEDCVELKTNRQLNDVYCSKQLSTSCMIEAKKAEN